MKFKDKLKRFMYGRNGIDQLYYFLMGINVLLIIICLFLGNTFKLILLILTLVSVVYMYYRVFSKDLEKRKKENQSFVNFFKIRYNKIKYRKVYYYKKCKSCRKLLRFKRIPGNHTATCPNCKNKIEIKIRG